MTSPEVLKPTNVTERISSVDIVRGISLLGILLMNIVGMGLYKAYMDPTNSGGATGWNLNVWWMNTLFFEGTMRAMFSMLFGAGILLFTDRSSEKIKGSFVTDVFFRRLLWLLLFGIIHAYLLLWVGEILFAYAVIGMFAFSFRHLSPKKLIIGTTVILLLTTAWSVKDYFQIKSNYDESTMATTKKSKGDSLTKEDKKAIETWEAKVEEEKASPEKMKDDIEEMHKGYFSIVKYMAPKNQMAESVFLYRYNFLDVLAMMLLGMAFLKNGILKAARSNRFYFLMIIVGYSFGLTINYLEGNHIVSNQFAIVSFYKTYMTYDVGRVATTMGHIGLIMLFIKSGWLKFLQKSLAAVGRMAFTNYIMHSIIANFIFLGYGFAMFGKLQRYELYYVVAGIWIFQLIASPIWLRYFRFGPLEWAWRSLTYWERQPFLKEKK